MSIEHIIRQEVVADGQTLSERLSFTGSAGINVDEQGSGAVTDLAVVGFSIDVSALQYIYIKASTNMTLEFGDASTPDKTLALVANKPFLWHNQSLQANPFGSTDVDSLFITKAGSGAWRLQIKGLVDATP
jgi:hypothetical protein